MVSFLLQENLDPKHYVGWRSDADPRVQRTSRDRDGKAEPSSQAKGPSIAIQVLTLTCRIQAQGGITAKGGKKWKTKG